MSFTPSPGSRVRLCDGREATISYVDPQCRADRAVFADGHEETLPYCDAIEEILEEIEEKQPTAVVTIRLSKEAAEKLLANPPKELAGFKVLSIEPDE